MKRVFPGFPGLVAGLVLVALSACTDLTAPPPDDDGSDKGPEEPRKEWVELSTHPLPR